jgi:glc operon protein GlcG
MWHVCWSGGCQFLHNLGAGVTHFSSVEFKSGEVQVKSRVALEANDVQAALDAARTEAVKNGWVVSIALVDDGGHLLGFIRLTDAAPLSAQISVGKARTAALARRESKIYEDVVKNGRTAFLSVSDLTMLEGGVPVIVGGHCVGALGVSGVKSDQDAQIANAGVQAIVERQ